MASFFRRRDPKKGKSIDAAVEESLNSTMSTKDLNRKSRSRKKQGEETEEGSSKSSPSSYFKVTIPSNAKPGNKFQVYVGNRIVSSEYNNNDCELQ